MDQIDWNLIRAFCATAETGSLSAAARKLGLTQPTLSRQVAALESALGTTLFARACKQLVLTVTGIGLLEHAQIMTAAADALVLAAAGRSQDVAGRVSISATEAFAVYLLPGIIEDIRRVAPQITIVIVASDAISDLSRREADIAIRHLRPTEPELIGRLMGSMEAHLYAAEHWVQAHGRPASPADLSGADLMGVEPVDRYCAHLRSVGLPVTADQFRIVSENSLVLWEMVRRGLGVSMMLQEIAAQTPGVVRVLPGMPGVQVPVWLVTHRELRTSRRIRVVFEILAEALLRKPAPDQALQRTPGA